MKSLFSFLLFIIVVCNISAQNRQKIIFDCDLGGDIDDAYALALLLSSSEEIDLLGIVLDHGRTKDRALIAAKMLKMIDKKNIPIFVGRETPQNLTKDTIAANYERQLYWAQGYSGFKESTQTGADFISSTLKKYPNEVILMTVGPIPNIGDILRKDPNVLKLAKEVVSMFGSFYTGYKGSKNPSVEYNVLMDLESSKSFSKSGANITYIGLEVTDHVKLEMNECTQIFMRQTPLTDALSALYSLWRGDWGSDFLVPTLYDVVAVGYVLWPELFKTKSVHVEISDEGYTKVLENKKPNCKIALEIDEKEFMNRFMHKLLTQNLAVEK